MRHRAVCLRLFALCGDALSWRRGAASAERRGLLLRRRCGFDILPSRAVLGEKAEAFRRQFPLQHVTPWLEEWHDYKVNEAALAQHEGRVVAVHERADRKAKPSLLVALFVKLRARVWMWGGLLELAFGKSWNHRAIRCEGVAGRGGEMA